MDYVATMGEVHGVRQGLDKVSRRGRRRQAPSQPCRQRSPLHQFESAERQAGVFTDLEDLHNVRVL